MGRRSRRCERYHGDLHLRRMTCHCGEVKARLVWPMNHDVKAYNVSWREASCSTSQEKLVSHRKKSWWKVVQVSISISNEMRSRNLIFFFNRLTSKIRISFDSFWFLKFFSKLRLNIDDLLNRVKEYKYIFNTVSRYVS